MYRSVDITYASGWRRRRRAPREELAADEARRKHDQGELYHVVVSDGGTTIAWLEVDLSQPFVGVNLLHEDGRDDVEYVIRAHPDGHGLFLRQARFHEYEGGEPYSRHGVVYHFEPDGSAHVESRAVGAETTQVYDLPASTPLASALREPMPSFGDYANLIRRERLEPSPTS